MYVHLLWIALSAFFVGVGVQSFLIVPLPILIIIVVLGIVALYGAYRWQSTSLLLIVGVALISGSIGVVRMQTGILELSADVTRLSGSKVKIEGIVVGQPDVRQSSVRVPIEVRTLQGQPHQMDARVLAVVPLHSAVGYGDRVEAVGVIHEPTVFETSSGRVFDYPQFLAKDGVGYELSFAKIKVLVEGERKNPMSYAIQLKQWFLVGLGRSLSEPAAGLAGGITVGDKRGLGDELSDTFRAVGLTHIIVLSGYNIMVVINALLNWGARLPTVARIILGATVAVFFAAITGFASASSRAAAMAVIAIAGKASGRIYIAGRILLVVAFVMVLWNPYVLAFDPGFQLSILATAGLIWFTPAIASRLSWITERFGLREVFSATIGTQASVLPLLLYQSGEIPLYSLFANIFALVVIPYAMLASVFAALGGLILGPLAPVVGLPAYALLEYIIGIATFFAWLPYATVLIPAFSGWLLLGIYGAVVLLIVRAEKKTAREFLAAESTTQ